MYTYINILCEGPSEERFGKEILAPYFAEKCIFINPIILGGVSTYAKIRRELKRWNNANILEIGYFIWKL